MLSVSNNLVAKNKDGALVNNNPRQLSYQPPLAVAHSVRFTGDQLSLSNNLQADNVSFEGLSKGGKLGIAGSVLLLILGAAGVKTAKAHTVLNQHGQPIMHKHEIPGSTRMYFDSNGSVVVSASNAYTRVDPGMQELERVYDQYNNPIGWREITRVYDEKNQQKRIDHGDLITNIREANPNFNNLPGWADDILNNTPNGGTVIIPRPDFDPIPPNVKNSTRVEVYMDSDGNLKVKVATGKARRGCCEYEKVFGPGNRVGWRKVTRVYRNGQLVRVEKSSTVIYRNSPFDTGFGNVPPWLIKHMNNMSSGHYIVIPESLPPAPVYRTPGFVPPSNQNTGIEFYFDSQGNWSMRAHQSNTRVRSNMYEYERVYESGTAIGWRKVTRVYKRGKVVISRGTVIRGPLPRHPGLNTLPVWARQRMMGCQEGHRIFLPAPNFMPHPGPNHGHGPGGSHFHWRFKNW